MIQRLCSFQKEPTLNNFLVVIKSVNYLRTLLDTLGLTLVISLLQTISCTFVAYGFARFDFPCKKLLFGLVIFTLVIPTQAILLPLYIKFQFFNPLQFFNFSNLTGVSIINTPLPFVLPIRLRSSVQKRLIYLFVASIFYKFAGHLGGGCQY